jgi:hypothetical protein
MRGWWRKRRSKAVMVRMEKLNSQAHVRIGMLLLRGRVIEIGQSELPFMDWAQRDCWAISRPGRFPYVEGKEKTL